MAVFQMAAPVRVATLTPAPDAADLLSEREPVSMSLKPRTRACAGMFGLALTLALTGCPKPNVDGPDAGLPDPCNNKEAALSLPDCNLTPDNTPLLAYISTPGDQDWYRIELPATLNARSLVHVRGGYAAANTAVNLSINVLKEDASSSLARGVDRHGQAGPKPVDLIFPFSQASARLLVLVGDEAANPAAPNFDVRAQYSLQAEVLQNPDVNEPNDATPTVIPLTQGAQYASGSQTGYLATTDDVDRFSFNVTTPTAARRIAYVHLTADKISPPPPFRLSYALLSPTGTTVAEGRVDNEFLAVDLATARIVTAGTWQIVVQAYHSPNAPGPIAGDLRVSYKVEVRVMDEQDTHEPNEVASDTDPGAVTLSTPDGTTRSRTGRIDHVGDQDWHLYKLAANAAPTLIHYKLTWNSAAGRFPPLPGNVDRLIRVFNRVTAADAPTAQNLCLNDSTVCPKGDDGDPGLLNYVNGYCKTGAPLCMRSERNESLVYPNLRNFEGVLPVPPHASPWNLFFYVGDDGNDWADDRDYTLSLEWKPDADETARTSAGVEQVSVLPMAMDSPTNAGYPAPPASATQLNGTLSHGYGRLARNAPVSGDGVRGPLDYDAVPSDVDRYEIDLPPQDPDAGPLDRTWELQWKVDHTPDGGHAYELGLDITFCDGNRLDGGQCTPVGASSGQPLTLLYTPDNLASWHNTTGALQPVYGRTVTPANETVTALAYGCFCFEPRFVKGGKFFVNVTGVDRDRYDDVNYSVRMALTQYPQSYLTPNDGGVKSCPPPVAGGADGGCRFTR